MEESMPIKTGELGEFILGEAHRQNTMILETADALQTKVGLYLVFAIFAFTSQIELIKTGHVSSIVLDARFCVASSGLVIVAILYLLRAALVRSYIMPPLVNRFREQTTQMATTYLAKGCSDEETLFGIKNKLINSLGRAVTNNFQQNQTVSAALRTAAWMLASAILVLVLSAAYPALVLAWALAFH